MDRNFKLTIEYDGTDYHGWQRQAFDNTLQAEIEKALAIINRGPTLLLGAGRTDAGVHAFGQVAHFHCDTRLSPLDFQNALNGLLPKDIVIKECSEACEGFHSRFDAKGKIYQYRIYNTPIPSALFRQYSWHIRKKLDTGAMEKAAEHLLGIHDFAAFQGQGSEVKNTVRHILRAEFTFKKDLVFFEIQGNGFLRYMVRNIVGTLVEIGLGKKNPGDFHEILKSKDRTRAGATAPALGLFLMKVLY
ncbi:MAG: tRNA pseudouridine(38-40) synthase TruA [Proteobacteria bacterium]|nr:tRNA pseudouridine(38-40) synthase TruA [Pseudomonadota bacterium]MBU4468992.1 tRNA pseudouridine(38-40) synthase TruA [Pseudomonadota bacterium]MCG2750931.1 tRNA pseudouridine(38-40) synthase TruA [Desulfobacteraceae bacterium]